MHGQHVKHQHSHMNVPKTRWPMQKEDLRKLVLKILLENARMPPTPPPQKVKLERQSNHIVDYTPQVAKSYADRRRDPTQHRMHQRSVKPHSLYQNAF